MPETGTRALSAQELLDVNRLYYDSLWSGAQLVEPGRFNTWPLIQTLLPRGGRCLEVAPGLRPRLPLEGTQFVDVSGPALAKLARRGASAVGALITALPFADASFDLVCALDIVEHVDDDARALEELSRVARPDTPCTSWTSRRLVCISKTSIAFFTFCTDSSTKATRSS